MDCSVDLVLVRVKTPLRHDRESLGRRRAIKIIEEVKVSWEGGGVLVDAHAHISTSGVV
jgi:hypothetical protein